MTEAQMRSKVAKWLDSYVGCSEGSSKHRDILNVFNNSGLSGYKMSSSDPWCACAVSAAFIANGLAGKRGSGSLCEFVDCNCDNIIYYAKKQGIWIEDDSYKPKVGDVVLYAWSDSGIGDCTASTDHVGIVYSVSSSSFKVIEGNISNTVGYRTINVNGRYIRGFVAPKYSEHCSEAIVEPQSDENERSAFCIATGCQAWHNGSTPEPVYDSSYMENVIGSLNPRESAWCVGRIGNAYMVYYWVDNTDWEYKIGFVEYAGGTTF